MALTSIVLLPLVAILTIWGRDRLLVDDISSRQITLFSLYVFFTQLLVNVLSEVATSIFFSFGLQYVLLSLPLSIGLSVIAAVLVRLFAVPVWKVTSRLYLNYATPS
ncbi:hypothetical protein [Exiguobacterium qingdaonense]|uniref:hypothetical protein n=1 Tax=Exiguobacterium qingdaonense TaxID=2751251 RepID=UPI001BE66858|nr:hypothetical protein [Exiguobacterium qingdaonense]